MNIILIESGEVEQRFDSEDRVYLHVCDVLRMRENDVFDIGQIDGPRGKATIVKLDEKQLFVSIAWGERPEPVRDLTMLLGLSRPQTVQKQLNVLATLGVSQMYFFPTDRGEKGYAQSRVWRDGLWRRHVLEGVEQAFATTIPEVELFDSLSAVLDSLKNTDSLSCVLDNYEAHASLRSALESENESTPVVVAIGSERGWSAKEREDFRAKRFTFAHLGSRVLRCETAATVSAASVLGAI
ncbi:MAG: 16S rRNA (uracil(1498)-N(3))-methyltransferase [Opitutales bacterium]